MFSKIITAFSAIALTPFLLSAEMGEKKKDKEPICESPFHAMHVGVRHTESKGVGYKEGYTTLEGFGIYDGWPSFMPFLDLRGHVFNSGKVAGNIGIGERSVIPSIDHIFGLYLYYDTRQSDHGLKVNQLSPGLELLGERMEYRVNGYFHVGKHKGHKYDSEFNKFSGHQIILQSKRKYAMSGWDGEVGVHLTQSTRNDFYLGAGPYYFTSDPSSAWGGKARVYWRFKEYVSLEASYTYDHLFKSIVQGTATVSYPFGPKLKRKGTGCPNPDDLGLSRAAFAPNRFEIPVIRKKRERDAAINPATGQPWQVWFVNNTSSSDGTFESPFPTLVQAQNASSPNDMIYVFPGDGTTKGMDQGITLKDVQKLFGSGTDQTIATQEGNIVIPAQTSNMPTITSLIWAVLLANNNEVSGLSFAINVPLSPPSTGVILGVNINSASIHDNVVFGTAPHSGIAIEGFQGMLTGTFEIFNNKLTSLASTSLDGIFVDNTNVSIIIKNNNILGYQQGIRVQPFFITSDFDSGTTCTITQNTVTNSLLNGINVISNSGGFYNVQNNTISNTSPATVGISVSTVGTPDGGCVIVDSNQISALGNSGSFSGIFVVPGGAVTNSTTKVLVTNNNVALPANASTNGVLVSSIGATNTICLDLENNIVTGASPAVGFVIAPAGSTGVINIDSIEGNIGSLAPTVGTINLVPEGQCNCSL